MKDVEVEYWELVGAVEIDPVRQLLLISAEENASMEGTEAGFADFTERWFRVVLIGYEGLLNAQEARE